MDMDSKAYLRFVAERAKPSPLGKDCALAFFIGGSICTLGQGLLNAYLDLGLGQKAAGTAVSCTLIGLSALLTGLNCYHRIARYGGAGTLVPITGFANAMVSPAMEFRAEGLVTGTGARMFQVAGPVLVYGISASTVYGLLYWLLAE